jgi:hypothetical protein
MRLSFSEEKVFIFILMVICCVFLILGLMITNPKIHLVPLLVSVPMVIAVIWELIIVSFPGIKESLVNVYNSDKKGGVTLDAGDDKNETPEQKLQRGLFCGWLVIFGILSVFLGLMASIAISSILYFKWLAKLSWLRSLVNTAGWVGFIYILFVLVLRLRLS